MGKFIALDTETTGVDFCSSQVIQCGAIFLDDSMQPVHRKEWNINYIEEKFSWCTEAEEVHRISKENSKKHGISPEVFLKEFEREVIKHYGMDAINEVHIIAANAYFDYLMLHRLWEEYRSDVEMPISRRVVDLSSLSMIAVGVSGMSKVLEHLGIPKDEEKAHSALYDAELHLKIFHSLMSILNQDGTMI